MRKGLSVSDSATFPEPSPVGRMAEDFDRETGAGAACDADVDGSAVSLTAEDAEGETIVDTVLALGALNEWTVSGSLDVLAVALRILS